MPKKNTALHFGFWASYGKFLSFNWYSLVPKKVLILLVCTKPWFWGNVWNSSKMLIQSLFLAEKNPLLPLPPGQTPKPPPSTSIPNLLTLSVRQNPQPRQAVLQVPIPNFHPFFSVFIDFISLRVQGRRFLPPYQELQEVLLVLGRAWKRNGGSYLHLSSRIVFQLLNWRLRFPAKCRLRGQGWHRRGRWNHRRNHGQDDLGRGLDQVGRWTRNLRGRFGPNQSCR